MLQFPRRATLDAVGSCETVEQLPYRYSSTGYAICIWQAHRNVNTHIPRRPCEGTASYNVNT